MALFTFATITTQNVSQLQDRSRQLDELARGDFASIPRELALALPRTADAQVRALPFAQRYVTELSGLYTRPSVRRFLATGISTAAWQKLTQTYADGRVDRAMDRIEKAVWVQNTVYALVIPRGLGVQLLPVLPWQVAPTVADTLLADSPAGWSKVEILAPGTITDGVTTWGKITLTPTEAWREASGKKTGLYARDGSHPFGAVPLAMLQRESPTSGDVFAPLNESVRNLQIALCLHEADTELLVRHCAWPQKVITGAQVAQLVEEIALGPDKVFALTATGDPNAVPPRLEVVQGQLPLTELSGWVEGRIKLYCALLGIDPSAFLRVNTSVTASARLFSWQIRKEQIDRLKPLIEQFETDVARLVTVVLNQSGAVAIPADVQVAMTWQESMPSFDPQAEAVALKSETELGITSPVAHVAQRDGISLALARAKVEANLQASRELGVVAPKIEPVAAIGDQVDGAPVAVEAVSDTALNGAQVAALQEIIIQVAQRQLPPAAAIAMLQVAFPTMDASFTPVEPAQTVAAA